MSDPDHFKTIPTEIFLQIHKYTDYNSLFVSKEWYSILSSDFRTLTKFKLQHMQNKNTKDRISFVLKMKDRRAIEILTFMWEVDELNLFPTNKIFPRFTDSDIVKYNLCFKNILTRIWNPKYQLSLDKEDLNSLIIISIRKDFLQVTKLFHELNLLDIQGKNVKNKWGVIAAEAGSVDTLKFLKETLRLDIRLLDDLIFYTALRNNQVEIIRYLINIGVDCHITDGLVVWIVSENGMNYENHLNCLENTKMLKLLLNNGLKVPNNGLILWDALYNNRISILQLMLQRTKVTDSLFVWKAISFGNFKLVQMLIENGVIVGWSSILYAFELGYFRIAFYCLFKYRFGLVGLIFVWLIIYLWVRLLYRINATIFLMKYHNFLINY